MRKGILLPLACSFLSVFDDASSKKDLTALAGVWRFALVQVDGKKQPAVPFATNKMIISKDGNYVIIQGKNVTRGTVRVEPDARPKHYDVTLNTGPLKGTTFKGIYDVDAGTLRVCFSLQKKERPAALGSDPGSGLLYEVFSREKQDVGEALREAAKIEQSR